MNGSLFQGTKLVSFFGGDVAIPEQLTAVIESLKNQLDKARTTNLKVSDHLSHAVIILSFAVHPRHVLYYLCG